ncbi:TRAP transporter small permease [Bosea caraganae]|uniref:TRAP transporter small permease protein n=1 Tax=Bosea caraganae TaxID=2763117 RepID=A0A370L6Z8_9HYPH|nr:TRAP transporter small permease [Bosea caraganae]RDJ25494.1 TRAP transporter small permease [Bosea caraganae]RDJ25719.1 TRAP transporter small permease [Bosea caraganae]
MMQAYVRAMDLVSRLTMIIAGACLVVITLIIPYGVFTRYVLNVAASWPEPMAVLLMIWFSFLSAAICYRENLHIAVNIIPDMLSGAARTMIGWVVELCMASTSLFMFVWGAKLVQTTFYQSIAEFPWLSVGLTYLPIPIGGAITTLFVIERLWTGRLFQAAHERDDALAPISTE